MSGFHPDASPPPLIKDDSEEEEMAADEGQAGIERRLHDMPNHTGPLIIQLNDNEDEERHEDEIRPSIAQVIDLTEDEPRRRPQRQRSHAIPQRNTPIADHDRFGQYPHGSDVLKTGVTIEIPAQQHLYQASFLHITEILKKRTSEGTGIFLRGLPLTRTRCLRGQMPRLRNELCLVLQIDADDGRLDEVQAAIEIPLEQCMNTRACLFTNASFPEYRFPKDVFTDIRVIEEKASLVCRWKSRRVYKDAATRNKDGAPVEFIVAHIRHTEVVKNKFRVCDLHRLTNWRGGKVCGGAYDPLQPDGKMVVDTAEPEADDQLPIARRPGQRYTFADMFCGAGGASHGAKKAGFQVKLGCDNATGACNSYRQNYPESTLLELDIYDFIANIDTIGVRVDVVHLSPPCQFWSPAHTVAGVNDEANIAVLFSCHELVKKLRPRVFTLEQTFGILHPRFEHYFNALIHGFTQHNYSVRWKTINLVAWGCATRRTRLIMIGSCAGEELPPFPAPTHSERPQRGDGTKKYTTVAKMLNKIPANYEDHNDLHNPAMKRVLNRAPWDPNIPLKRTITCNGGYGNYHFSGKREFTDRELAVLQGFPVDYAFEKPNQKRQIGNAFPPPVVKTLYKHLRSWLEAQDKLLPAEEEPDSDEDVIVIDDDDDDDDDDDESGADSDVEYTGSRRLGSRASSATLDVSGPEDMDIDNSQAGDSPLPCADSVQRRAGGVVDLTRDSASPDRTHLDGGESQVL